MAYINVYVWNLEEWYRWSHLQSRKKAMHTDPKEGRGWRKLGEWGWHIYTAAAAANSRQSCPTLCDPIDGSPTDSSVPGILQWVVISFSNAWKWKVKMKSFSRVWLLATPWTVASQAPPSMGFSRQEYWSGVPLPSPRCFRPSSNVTSEETSWTTALTPGGQNEARSFSGLDLYHSVSHMAD